MNAEQVQNSQIGFKQSFVDSEETFRILKNHNKSLTKKDLFTL